LNLERIATGYSTSVPCHNPKDVIEWYITKLEGKEDPKSIIPWYRGYTGKIQVFDRRMKTKKGKKEAAEDENSRSLISMTTTGDFYTQKDGTVVITELPIGVWPYKYKEWLEKLIQTKQISEYRDLSGGDDTGENVYFELYNYKGAPSYKSLKLEKTIGMSNMVLLDEQNHPIRFDTTDDILESFYKRRLPIYQKRKDYQMNKLKEHILNLDQKIRFIEAIKTQKVDIYAEEESIFDTLDILELPHTLYKDFKLSSLNLKIFKGFKEDLASSEESLKVLEQTPIETIWKRDLIELKETYEKDIHRKEITRKALVKRMKAINKIKKNK
jgi:DNA topoisomerase II